MAVEIKETGEDGHEGDAIYMYMKELEAHPEATWLYYDIAFCYHRVEDHVKAFEWAEKSVAANPNDINAYYLLGGSAAKLHDMDRAIGTYTRALGVAPGEYGLLRNRARAYLETKMYAKAVADLSSYIRRFPRDAEALLWRARANFSRRKVKMSIKDCRRVLKIDPDNGMAKVMLEDMTGERPSSYHRFNGHGRTMPFTPMKVDDVTFADVVGLENAKRELRRDIVYPLLNRELAKEYEIAAGGGVMLYGPPGCGKTWIAKAVAGEAKVNLVEARISEVVSKWAGEHERNIHSAFESARRSAPSILFFDEIDMLGGRRDMNERHYWMRAGVNVFLTEMDGIAKSNDSVLVMGATNAPWYIDPALKRPGRFGSQVYVPPPGKEAREGLFRQYLNGRMVGEGMDYAKLAAMTGLYTAADIARICAEANKDAWESAYNTGVRARIGMGMLEERIAGTGPSVGEWYAAAGRALRSERDRKGYAELMEDIAKHERQMGAVPQIYR